MAKFIHMVAMDQSPFVKYIFENVYTGEVIIMKKYNYDYYSHAEIYIDCKEIKTNKNLELTLLNDVLEQTDNEAVYSITDQLVTDHLERDDRFSREACDSYALSEVTLKELLSKLNICE